MIFDATELKSLKCMVEVLNLHEHPRLLEIAMDIIEVFRPYRRDLYIDIVGGKLEIKPVDDQQAELPLDAVEYDGPVGCGD